MIAIAGRKQVGHRSIWMPATGRPYWIDPYKPNAGPDLTDEEIEKYLGRKQKCDIAKDV